MMKSDFDIAMVGSGFGGSLLAMIAKRLGHSVVLLERGAHPRFAIGESSTPLANLLLEELARRYHLPRLLPLTKWGTWQKDYPQIACGLKRGFTFYHHALDAPWTERPDRGNQLLVGASPHDAIGDTHWYRPDFDHFLVREAQAQGVEYVDRIELEKPEISPAGITLRGEREGKARAWSARLLIDASGPRGFLHRKLGLREKPFSHLPATQALFTHFTGVTRWENVCPSDQSPPYPPDDAALHHVFEGGWIWVLRFNNGITSAGVAATSTVAKELNLAEGAPAWERLLQRFPTVGKQFAGARPEFPFIHAPRLSFCSEAAAGEGWALLPSAAGFVDPLLSTGFPLTLLGIARLAEIIEQAWGTHHFNARLKTYAEQTLKEVDAAEQMVAALYANMNNFPIFRAVSLLYFAAASFTETARRLGRPELAGGSFLLGDHPQFGVRSRQCLSHGLAPLAPAEEDLLLTHIYETIGPVDVAGLGDLNRRNWYPVNAEDLLKAAPKLGVTEKEIHELLTRCGFTG